MGHTDLSAYGRDIHDASAPALAHRGEQSEDEPHRTQVVEVDRPLEVVEPFIGLRDPPPDRKPRVRDHDVDVIVVVQHLRDELADRVRVGQVARVCERACALLAEFLGDPLEQLAPARHQQHRGTGRGEPPRARLADSGRGARHQDDLPVDGVPQPAVADAGAGRAEQQADRARKE